MWNLTLLLSRFAYSALDSDCLEERPVNTLLSALKARLLARKYQQLWHGNTSSSDMGAAARKVVLDWRQQLWHQNDSFSEASNYSNLMPWWWHSLIQPRLWPLVRRGELTKCCENKKSPWPWPRIRLAGPRIHTEAGWEIHADEARNTICLCQQILCCSLWGHQPIAHVEIQTLGFEIKYCWRPPEYWCHQQIFVSFIPFFYVPEVSSQVRGAFKLNLWISS